MTNCQMYSNSAGFYGGALYCQDASAVLANCLVYDNDAPGLAPVFAFGSSTVYIANSTIAENTGSQAYAGVYCNGPSIGVISNSIVWHNTDGTSDEVYGSVDVSSNNYIGSPPAYDPLFAPRHVPGPWYGDYYLSQVAAGQQVDSPCVNAGSGPGGPLARYTTRTDLVADDGTVDVGYHYWPADCNDNGRPDPLEIADGTSADCNYNGIPDYCDIYVNQTSLDNNEDGVPDECQGRPHCALFSTAEEFNRAGQSIPGWKINVRTPATDGYLERNPLAIPMPFIAVPATERGTLIRMCTEDVQGVGAEGHVLGEYPTAPSQNHPYPQPSRTAVDLDGNVWVANRNDIQGDMGSVTRIGLTVGGTRCDASGADNANGEYLKPPFLYNTCVDKNGDGLIRTSRGLYTALAWTNAAHEDDGGAVSSADDECICNYIRVAALGTRHLSVDRDNNVWVSGEDPDPPPNDDSNPFSYLDGETGGLLNEPFYAPGGYGGLVTCFGSPDPEHFALWSTNRPQSGNNTLLWYAPLSSQETWTLDPGDPYGVAMDRDGNIWNTQRHLPLPDGPSKAMKYAPDGSELFAAPKLTGGNAVKCVAVTLADNDVWIASTGETGFDHFLRRLDAQGENGVSVELNSPGLYDGLGPTGLAIDAIGRVWVPCNTSPGDQSDKVKVVAPGSGHNGAYLDGDGYDLGFDADPYSYSDMTGQVTLHTTQSGTWTVVHDGEKYHANWHRALWNRTIVGDPEPNGVCPDPVVPDGAELTVEVRASDVEAGLSRVPYFRVFDNERFTGVQGRFLQIRVRFKGACPDGATPYLCNLVVYNDVGDVNGDGLANNFDVTPFVYAITHTEAQFEAQYPAGCYWCADVNEDGFVNNFDVTPFVHVITDATYTCP